MNCNAAVHCSTIIAVVYVVCFLLLTAVVPDLIANVHVDLIVCIIAVISGNLVNAYKVRQALV